MKAQNILLNKLVLGIIALSMILTACSKGEPTSQDGNSTTSTQNQTTTTIPTESEPSPTVAEPTPTPAPLAASVNGIGITLDQFESELARYQKAVGRELTDDDKQKVLDDLIDNLILAQAAREQGYEVTDEDLQMHIEQLTTSLGSADALNQWMTDNGYDEDSFRQALKVSILAAWMRDEIIEAVPETADQVHARQILTYTEEEAKDVLTQLKAGNDFENLASRYNPVTKGDIGWFPRGYLPDIKIEEAAFSLEPGAFSDIIKTLAGYHIIQVIERDKEHPLSPDARRVLQANALQSWLEEQRNTSHIEIFIK